MKRKIISPIHLTLIAFMAILPALAVVPVRAQAPTLAVNPALVSQDPGGFFDISVDMSDVANLVAYDITLDYDASILSAVAVNFDNPGTILSGTSHACAQKIVDDVTGEIIAACTLLGGVSMNVGPATPVLMVRYQVVGITLTSNLDLRDTHIAVLVDGAARPLGHSAFDAVYFLPPKILILKPNATVSPSQRVRFLSKGESDVTLVGFVQLSPDAPFGAFGGIQFTIVDPLGGETTVDSDLAFMFPGGMATVTGSYSFGDLTGKYRLFATAIRCTFPTACFLDKTTTLAGLHFFVHR